MKGNFFFKCMPFLFIGQCNLSNIILPIETLKLHFHGNRTALKLQQFWCIRKLHKAVEYYTDTPDCFKLVQTPFLVDSCMLFSTHKDILVS